MSTCLERALVALMCSRSTYQIAGCPLDLTPKQQNLAHLWLLFDAGEDIESSIHIGMLKAYLGPGQKLRAQAELQSSCFSLAF